MMKFQIELSELHVHYLRELAARENMTPDELAAKIIGEAIAQAEYFDRRAMCGSHDEFLKAMSKVPDVPPVPPDTAAR